MPFGWDDLILLGSTIYGAYQADRAADKSVEGGKDALALQQQQYNNAMMMLEPTRALGYGAQSDLASLYGYQLPQYQTAASLLGGPGGYGGPGGGGYPGGGAPSAVRGIGSASGDEWYSRGLIGTSLNVLGLGGRRDPQVSVRDGMIYFDGRKDGGTLYGGHINPYTGEVWVDTPNGQRDARLSEEATAALRGGGSLTGGRWGRFNMALSELQRSGWTYNPEAIANAQTQATLNPAAPGTPGNPTAPAEGSTAPGNMSRFFASPDYQFRRDEGIRGIEQGAAARGGALSGNAMRGVTEFNSGLASQEYGNYFERLARMAGMGGAATNNAVSVGQNYANVGGNLMQGMGDARASGVMGSTNTLLNGANNFLNNWMLERGGWYDRPSYTVPSDITDFQYPFDRGP